MGRINIRDLKVHCVVGTKPVERNNRQKVVINISLDVDFSKAAKSDRLEDTLNYKKLKDDIVEMVSQSDYHLLERLAEKIADICLKEKCVTKLRLSVEKPYALTDAGSVGVEIERTRPLNRRKG